MGKVKHTLAYVRNDMASIFKKQVALINNNGTGHQCTGLNGHYHPEQDARVETNKINMVKEAQNENYQKLPDLKFQLVNSIDPLRGEGTGLHN